MRPATEEQLDRQSLVLLVLGLVMLGVDAAALAAWGWYAPEGAVGFAFAFSTAWLVAGAVALALRRTRLARLMVLFGCLLAADMVGRLELGAGGVPASLLATTAALLVLLQAPVAAQLLLSFPTGVLDPPGRLAVRCAVGWAVAQALWLVLFPTSPACAGCADNLLAVGPPARPVALVVGGGIALGWLALAGWVAALLVRRYRESTPRQRRVLRLPYLALIPSLSVFVIVTLVEGREGGSPFEVPWTFVVVLQVLGLMGVPLGFVAGLLRDRLSYARIGDLVLDLGSPGAHDVRAALAEALEDPTLEVAFPTGAGLVDAAGVRVEPVPDGRRLLTPVGDPDDPLAVLVHDRSLDDEPALLLAASSAVRLALENARLRAQVLAQLHDIQESRARIVTATDEARRRLERDLHDGAQQRLLAVGMALRMLRDAPPDPALLAEAERELTAGLRELRELAAGIHPAVLTDRGLLPALHELATRMGPTVDVRAEPLPRLPSPVEAALYFATAEAVANAVKHAAPRHVVITVDRLDDRVVVQVADDGGGGADPSGAGLRGIADRMAAVDGVLTLSSRVDHGTLLTLDAPCG